MSNRTSPLSRAWRLSWSWITSAAIRRCPPGHPQSRREAVLPADILAGLDPIEQVFAKLKHQLRKAQARMPDAVCAAIGQLLGAFNAAECANYLANSGYERA